MLVERTIARDGVHCRSTFRVDLFVELLFVYSRALFGFLRVLMAS